MDKRTTMEFDTAKLMADVRRVVDRESLRQIADDLGSVSAATLSRMDRGHVPDMQTFMALCLECELNPGDYFKRVFWMRVEDTSQGEADGVYTKRQGPPPPRKNALEV